MVGAAKPEAAVGHSGDRVAKAAPSQSGQTDRRLRAPPGNRLEALRGGGAGQYSLRVNDQWRICFTWGDGGPDHVEIVDYH